ncbi:unnamed protein product, partial [Laminaria digitata]
LLESAYELGVAGLLVPMVMGVYVKRGGELAALAAMGCGMLVWGLHMLLGWSELLQPWLTPLGLALPIGLASAVLGLIAY